MDNRSSVGAGPCHIGVDGGGGLPAGVVPSALVRSRDPQRSGLGDSRFALRQRTSPSAHPGPSRLILDAKDFDRWLDPAQQDPKKLEALLVPYSGKDLTAYSISTWVNSPRNQGPKCIEPIGVGE
jgi:hypothetical protein